MHNDGKARKELCTPAQPISQYLNNVIYVLYMYMYVVCRKYVNYRLDWNVDVAKNLVAVAPYGGPVGKMIHILFILNLLNCLPFVAVFPKVAQKKKTQHITIYSQSGRPQSHIPVSVLCSVTTHIHLLLNINSVCYI